VSDLDVVDDKGSFAKAYSKARALFERAISLFEVTLTSGDCQPKTRCCATCRAHSSPPTDTCHLDLPR